jgi:uncharacterized protein YbbK (DUF523 family)
MRRRDDDRPAVGISACLLGEAVRYDGAHKRRDVLARDLARVFFWVPVCPEVELGLGVPREPIRLQRAPGGTRLVSEDGRRDLTAAMSAYAAERLEALRRLPLRGYVLKARSPSCGLSVEVTDETGAVLADVRAPGRFAAAVEAAFPGLPVAEDEELEDPAQRAAFLARVRAFPGR